LPAAWFIGHKSSAETFISFTASAGLQYYEAIPSGDSIHYISLRTARCCPSVRCSSFCPITALNLRTKNSRNSYSCDDTNYTNFTNVSAYFRRTFKTTKDRSRLFQEGWGYPNSISDVSTALINSLAQFHTIFNFPREYASGLHSDAPVFRGRTFETFTLSVPNSKSWIRTWNISWNW